MTQPRDHQGEWGKKTSPEPDLSLLGDLNDNETAAVSAALAGRRAPSPQLVEARDVLLRGFDALAPQAQALTIIGPQAVFEMTRHRDDLPFTLTTDADTALTPALVDPNFDIGAAMVAAGFKLKYEDRPGIWALPGEGAAPANDDAGFDILVPGTLAGRGRRSATVAGQGKQSVGRADGIELSVVDRHLMRLEALDGSGRSVDAYVAGPGAIMSAKAYKLTERIEDRDAGKRDRVKPKDASDAWLLMQVSDPEEVRSVFAAAEHDTAISPTVEHGRHYLTTLFSDGGDGADLAVADLRGTLDEALVRRSAATWMERFSAAP